MWNPSVKHFGASIQSHPFPMKVPTILFSLVSFFPHIGRIYTRDERIIKDDDAQHSHDMRKYKKHFRKMYMYIILKWRKSTFFEDVFFIS